MIKRTSRYVPILRSHSAERHAVKHLNSAARGAIAPLFELSRSTVRALEKFGSREAAKKIATIAAGSCGRGEMYLEFATLLEREDADEICREVEYRLLALQCNAQFVARVSDFERTGGIASCTEIYTRNGAGFRVTPADYINGDLAGSIAFFKRLGLTPSQVDLIVDCQTVDEGQPMRGTAERLESGYPWRSITYVGGSFPPNLAHLQKNDQYELPRYEWQIFSRESHPQGRVVRYGDYTVQHPHQADPLPRVLPSGSIRYASNTYWVVMRGEKLDNPNGPGYEQYIAQAQLLCERSEFRGANFSAGDAYIAFIASQQERTGNPSTWLQAAINHHLTLAAEQVQIAVAA
ncbi:MAG TPA: hypothetical protein VEU30_14850 [Thermoanaerobaculia bacterium]|nr:hypothetical protein [Thermoanaerobaculia bacterium]